MDRFTPSQPQRSPSDASPPRETRETQGSALLKKSARQPKYVAVPGGKLVDIVDVKFSVISKLQSRTRSLTRILGSNELDNFLIRSVSYCRWFLKVTHMEKTRQRAQQVAGFDPGANFTGKFGDFLKSAALFQVVDVIDSPPTDTIAPATTPQTSNTSSPAAPPTTTPTTAATAPRSSVNAVSVIEDLLQANVSIETARTEMRGALRQFAKAYCFLLLLISRASAEPAKERAYFEHVYALTKETTSLALQLPSVFAALVDQELNRLFRSSLFATAPAPATPTSVAALLAVSATTNTPLSVQPLQTPQSTSPPLTPPDMLSGAVGGQAGAKPGAPPRKFAWDLPPAPATITAVARTSRDGARRGASGTSEDPMQPDFARAEFARGGAGLVGAQKGWRRKISINDVRMARSPLADAILPPPQRFLFVQTRSSALISNLGV